MTSSSLRPSLRGVRAAAAAPSVDPVTGAVARDDLLDRVGAEVARAGRHDLPLAVLAVELPGSQEMPARRLRAIAAAIERTLRAGDTLARCGSASFTVALPGRDPSQARRTAVRVLAALERLGGWDDGACRIGIASYPDDGACAGELIAAAWRTVGDGEALVRRVAAEPATQTGEQSRWPVRRVLPPAAAAGAAATAAWFLGPLVLPETVVRTVLIVLAMVALAIQLALTARSVRGRERRGWAVMAAAVTLAPLPLVGTAYLILFPIGLLLAVGRSWRRDLVRAIDALIVAVTTAALVYAVVLLPMAHAGGLDEGGPVRLVAAAAGAALALTVVFLVGVTVPRRRRPDAWLLLGGYALSCLLPLAYLATGRQLHSALHAPWESLLVVEALPMIAGAVLRRRGPVQVLGEPARVEPSAGLWVSTVLLIALIVSSLVVHGDVPLLVGASLVVTLLLRTARVQVIQHQRRRFASLARVSAAGRAVQQRASLEALARALEARDGYTGRHGEETVEIAVRVAVALGLEPAEVEEVRTVALLHDIGKIGIPNEILHKEGPLDDDEWERMREHPVIGERILRAVPGLERVAAAVRHEHERWDGHGYPDGLAGEEIPLASRITLVCDAWHAMTSDRPYRRAMPVQDAVAQLVHHAGSQFDRAVVRALLQVLDREGVVGAAAGYQAAA